MSNVANGNGYLKLWRKARFGWLAEAKPWQRCLWYEMLMMAHHEQQTGFLYGSSVALQPGQFIITYSELARRAEVTRKTIKRWLDTLVEARKISIAVGGPAKVPPDGRKSPTPGVVVTLIKWPDYQGNGTGRSRQSPAEVPPDDPPPPSVSSRMKKEEERTLRRVRENRIRTVCQELPPFDTIPDRRFAAYANAWVDLFDSEDRVVAEIYNAHNWYSEKKRVMKDYGKFLTNWMKKAAEPSSQAQLFGGRTVQEETEDDINKRHMRQLEKQYEQRSNEDE